MCIRDSLRASGLGRWRLLPRFIHPGAGQLVWLREPLRHCRVGGHGRPARYDLKRRRGGGDPGRGRR
eukprot:8034519-Pyramimonas_sp.AAC.1